MYYRAKNVPKKVKQRIMRHKRTRYHNDAALFNEESYSTPRKRTLSLRSRMTHTIDNE
jgi:hypothetical protein